ncbi:class I SAM-dependent methyltransferase [bacterium]|nr:class I SAM-dependent methyltransferase [bacterium]
MSDLISECAYSIGASIDMMPFIPEMLSGLWDIGASSERIVELVGKNYKKNKASCIDLGCGKGSIAIKIAKNFKFNVLGIDGIGGFIEEAKQYAKKYNVSNLCKFEVNDIRKMICKNKKYDLVIMAAVGGVLGDIGITVKKLKRVTKSDGIIIIDDCVLSDDSLFKSDKYLFFSEAKKCIKSQSLKIIDYYMQSDLEMKEINDYNTKIIKKNVERLKEKYSDKIRLFEKYVKNQIKESEELVKTKGIIWVLNNKSKKIR